VTFAAGTASENSTDQFNTVFFILKQDACVHKVPFVFILTILNMY